MSNGLETSSAAHGPVVAHRFLLAVLHSPLGRMFGGLCELRFVGRISGRTISLPVQYVREGTRLVVYVSHASDKRWWRNFIDGLSVQVHVAGLSCQGHGHVVGAGHPDRAWAERTYHRHHPRVELMPTAPMVVIDIGAGEAEGITRDRSKDE